MIQVSGRQQYSQSSLVPSTSDVDTVRVLQNHRQHLVQATYVAHEIIKVQRNLSGWVERPESGIPHGLTKPNQPDLKRIFWER